MPPSQPAQPGPSGPSRQVSLLIFVKCLCEAAAENYEKALADPLPQRMPKDERVWAEELQQAIAAAHLRMGDLIGQKGK